MRSTWVGGGQYDVDQVLQLGEKKEISRGEMNRVPRERGLNRSRERPSSLLTITVAWCSPASWGENDLSLYSEITAMPSRPNVGIGDFRIIAVTVHAVQP